MSVIKTEELANVIREKVGIYIDSNNKDKATFFKDELLVIIARLDMLENEAKRNNNMKQVVAETVNEVFKQSHTINNT